MGRALIFTPWRSCLRSTIHATQLDPLAVSISWGNVTTVVELLADKVKRLLSAMNVCSQSDLTAGACIGIAGGAARRHGPPAPGGGWYPPRPPGGPRWAAYST
jgi:hypothetical protein